MKKDILDKLELKNYENLSSNRMNDKNSSTTDREKYLSGGAFLFSIKLIK